MTQTSAHTSVRCPFYGVGQTWGLIRWECNQCAFKNLHSPCDMEVAGERPDWDRCVRKSQTSQSEIAGLMKQTLLSMMPREPDIPFSQWFAKVMSR